MGATGSIVLYAAQAAAAGAAVYTAVKGSPKPPRPPLMPDQTSIDQGQQLKAAQEAAQRNGRASTVLTNNSNTGDLLGP